VTRFMMFLPRVCRRALTKWFAAGDQRFGAIA
jgi:hypothetical protein